jgi:isopenicillin N synthase-like dioxygenase
MNALEDRYMDTQSIPVIDIGDLGRPSTLAALDAACRDWGFFQVVGHDLPPTVEEALRQQMRRFFAQPRAVRQQVSRSAENPWGYYDQELTKNTLDWKQVYDYGPADGDRLRPRWPDLPGFRNAILDYYGACEALALRLLAAVSTNLGMPA